MSFWTTKIHPLSRQCSVQGLHRLLKPPSARHKVIADSPGKMWAQLSLPQPSTLPSAPASQSMQALRTSCQEWGDLENLLSIWLTELERTAQKILWNSSSKLRMHILNLRTITLSFTGYFHQIMWENELVISGKQRWMWARKEVLKQVLPWVRGEERLIVYCRE